MVRPVYTPPRGLKKIFTTRRTRRPQSVGCNLCLLDPWGPPSMLSGSRTRLLQAPSMLEVSGALATTTQPNQKWGPSDDPAATTGTSGRAHGRTRRAGTRALKGRSQVARKRERGAHESFESVKFLLSRQVRLFIQPRVYGECRIGRPSKHGDKR